MQLVERVKIVEVSARDGLQNEPTVVSTEDKITFINMLSSAGLPVIEVSSCVSPKWVPQLADFREVFAGIAMRNTVSYPLLVPNVRGFEDGLGAGAEAVSIIASASESFSQKNNNCSIDEGLERCKEIIEQSVQHNISIRGYVSCTMGCPYEGPISFSEVTRVTEALYRMGCTEIALSDTIGVGTPGMVQAMIRKVMEKVPVETLAVHFHDTYGQALVNIFAALQIGVQTVDSSVAGLGGCPYASGASGNVASEDLLYMLIGLGIKTDVDLTELVAAGEFICSVLGRENRSRVAVALR